MEDLDFFFHRHRFDKQVKWRDEEEEGGEKAKRKAEYSRIFPFHAFDALTRVQASSRN